MASAVVETNYALRGPAPTFEELEEQRIAEEHFMKSLLPPMLPLTSLTRLGDKRAVQS